MYQECSIFCSMCYILHSVIRLKIQAYLSKKNVANKNTVRKHHLGITYTKGIHNWTPPPLLKEGEEVGPSKN